MTNVTFMIKKILIAEDNPDCCELLVFLLRRTGYDTVGVQSGEEAVAHALSDHPDLIFMDLGLPGLDGIAAATAIKQNPKTAGIPIVALSARLEQTWKAKALSAGMTMYLTKPAAPHAITRIIEQLTGADSTHREASSADTSPEAL
jgi:CheY-like chemotaxis protein